MIVSFTTAWWNEYGKKLKRGKDKTEIRKAVRGCILRHARATPHARNESRAVNFLSTH